MTVQALRSWTEPGLQTVWHFLFLPHFITLPTAFCRYLHVYAEHLKNMAWQSFVGLYFTIAFMASNSSAELLHKWRFSAVFSAFLICVP
ncbi:hypothetical protein HK23_07465 [Acetobacter malorum]|uniref:Uncharacterized protein n=1 Tax=Acetobacter malorum TaxID=178901 RepID=A0A1Y3G461_9PROT|nr:hypothetical protein HK23_07465 [Acetobacter malorum]